MGFPVVAGRHSGFRGAAVTDKNTEGHRLMITVTMTGLSGRIYLYGVYDYNGSWNDIPGNYAFAHKNGQGFWVLSYLGIADSYSNRMCSHERWLDARMLGATHVLAHVNKDVKAREAEERDLIAKYNPPLNTQNRFRVA
jgi:hypothetical protein